MVKKDRGRPTDPKAKPKAYGERTVNSTVPGVELLLEDDNETEDDLVGSDGEVVSDDEADHSDDIDEMGEDGVDTDIISASDDESPVNSDIDVDIMNTDDEDEADSSDDEDDINDEDEEEEEEGEGTEGHDSVGTDKEGSTNVRKRRLADFDASLLSADASLRALKRLASDAARETSPSDSNDGIYSNEDFQLIKQRKVCHPTNRTCFEKY